MLLVGVGDGKRVNRRLAIEFGIPLRDQLPELRRLHRSEQRHAAVQAQAFVGDEVKELVRRDPAAVGPAELIEAQRILGGRENRLGIERVIAKELVHGAVELVAAGLGHHVDGRRAVAAELGGEIVRRDPEFLNQVDVRIDGGAAGGELVVVVGAIEQEVVGAVALTVDERRVAAGRAAEDGIAGIRRGARLQLHQLEGVAAVERQLGDALLVDQIREAAFFGVDQRRVALHLDRFGQCAHLQREVEAHRFTDGDENLRTACVLKPCSSAVTAYVPRGRLVSRYSPAFSETVVRVSLVPVFLATTVTPGSTPPLESLTVPVSVPLDDCAKTIDGSNSKEREQANRDLGMTAPVG